MLDGRVLEASQVEYKPFGKPPLQRELSAGSAPSSRWRAACRSSTHGRESRSRPRLQDEAVRASKCSSVRCAGCLVAPPSSFTGQPVLDARSPPAFRSSGGRTNGRASCRAGAWPGGYVRHQPAEPSQSPRPCYTCYMCIWGLTRQATKHPLSQVLAICAYVLDGIEACILHT